jgi:hypothetical protein
VPQFNTNNIVSTEFGVCRESDAGELYVLVPVDNPVKDALEEMLLATVAALAAPEDDNHMAMYEPSQKYGTAESLRLPLNSDLCDGPRNLFRAQNIPIDVRATADPNIIEHYFAIFRDNNDRKVVAVRRATQFKGVVTARGRLIRMLDETLKILDDTVFKLDTVFDYLITEQTVYILHPSGFEYTADIDEQILAHAANNIQVLGQAVNCVNFGGLAQFVATRKRAARLLASLRTRADLAQTSLELLTQLCQDTGIAVDLAEGKLAPVAGQEMAFLMLLDRRRYHVSLVPNVEETYEAANRRGV